MKTWRNLNDKPLAKCYAFELRLIVENRREDGFRCGHRRRLLALAELQRRAENGDEKACAEILRCVIEDSPLAEYQL